MALPSLCPMPMFYALARPCYHQHRTTRAKRGGMSTTIRELLENGKGDAPAIITPGGPTLTYHELRSQVDHLAGQLSALGIGAGERVAIVLPNGPAAGILFLAVSACASAAPLNQAYREEEFRFYLDDLGAKALI